MEENIEFELSSGNIFADIGLENSEEMLRKSELVRQINSTIKQQNLSSIRIREILGLDEEMLSNLSKGVLTELRIEHLFRYLNILGRDLEVILQQGENSRLAEYSLSGLLEELDWKQSI
jgi:predicted XRE-type DNA-binding protein